MDHKWEDVSHHSIPVYQCVYCNQMKSLINTLDGTNCPKAESVLKRDQEREICIERFEHRQLMQRIAREKYLIQKYGDLPQ